MGNRFIEKEKKKINPMATAGIIEDEVVAETVNTKIEEQSKDEIENIENKDEDKVVELKVVTKEEKEETSDLFTFKKKTKIKKEQKNLYLKIENKELLENMANKYKIKEGELVDYLIENYLKLLKIK